MNTKDKKVKKEEEHPIREVTGATHQGTGDPRRRGPMEIMAGADRFLPGDDAPNVRPSNFPRREVGTYLQEHQPRSDPRDLTVLQTLSDIYRELSRLEAHIRQAKAAVAQAKETANTIEETWGA